MFGIIITGETYPHRKDLKKHKLTWSAHDKHWHGTVYHPTRLHALKAFCAEKGLRIRVSVLGSIDPSPGYTKARSAGHWRRKVKRRQ